MTSPRLAAYRCRSAFWFCIEDCCASARKYCTTRIDRAESPGELLVDECINVREIESQTTAIVSGLWLPDSWCINDLTARGNSEKFFKRTPSFNHWGSPLKRYKVFHSRFGTTYRL